MSGWRQWLNENPRAAGAVAVAVVAIAAGAVVLTTMRSAAQQREYFWNIDTGEVERVAYGQHPPIFNEQGHQLVRAYVYSCGRCTPQQWQVLRLERYPRAVLDRIRRLEAEAPGFRQIDWERGEEDDPYLRVEFLWNPTPQSARDDRAWQRIRTYADSRALDDEESARLRAMCEGGQPPRRCHP